MDRIVEPTVAAMAARGTPYMGVLYRRADDHRTASRS